MQREMIPLLSARLRGALCFVLLIGLVPGLIGAEEVTKVILSYFENISKGFTIVTPDGEVTPESIGAGGEIAASSTINTSEGDSVELQLLPSKSIIRITENTSFEIKQLQGVNSAESTDFQSLIGKFIAVLAKGDPTKAYNFNGRRAVMSVVGTRIIGSIDASGKEIYAVLDGTAVVARGEETIKLTAGFMVDASDTSLQPGTQPEILQELLRGLDFVFLNPDDVPGGLDPPLDLDAAQQNSQDPFATLDSGMSDSDTDGATLFKNMTVTTSINYDLYLAPLVVLETTPGDEVVPDKQDHLYELRQDFSDFHVFGDWGSFVYSGWIAFGNSGTNTSKLKDGSSAKDSPANYRYSDRLLGFLVEDDWVWQDFLQDTDRRSNFLQFDEAYFTLILPFLDLYVGQKIFTNKQLPDPLYSPLDIYKTIDANDPRKTKEMGKLLVQTDFTFGDFLLSAVVFPVYQGPKMLNEYSRWGYYYLHEKYLAEGNKVPSMTINENDDDRYIADITLGNMSYLVQGKLKLPQLDLMAHVFYGLANNRVVKTVGNNSYYEIKPTLQIGLSGLEVIENFKFFAETLFNWSPTGFDDTYLRYVIGTEVNVGALLGDLPVQDIRAAIEFAHDITLAEMNKSSYTVGQRYMLLDILAGIRIDLSESLRLDTALQWELWSKGFYVERMISFKLPSDYELSIALNWFPGADVASKPDPTPTSWYWRKNSRVSISIGRVL